MPIHSLSDIRKQIEDVDKSLLILLSLRTQLSREITKIKKKKNLDVIQLKTWEHKMKNRIKENKKLNLDSAFLDKIFNIIHKESIRIQKQELKKYDA